MISSISSLALFFFLAFLVFSSSARLAVTVDITVEGQKDQSDSDSESLDQFPNDYELNAVSLGGISDSSLGGSDFSSLSPLSPTSSAASFSPSFNGLKNLIPKIQTLSRSDLLAPFRISPELKSEFLQYRTWLIEHGKKFSSLSEELLKRFNQWRQNKRAVEEINQNPRNSFQWSLNQYSDLSELEFQRSFGGFLGSIENPDNSQMNNNPQEVSEEQTMEMELNAVQPVAPAAPVSYAVPRNFPQELNWAANRAVMNPVQDQTIGGTSECGSCAIFALTAVLEAADAIRNRNKPLLKVSEQNLMDCVRARNPNDQNLRGCLGNSYTSVAKYLMDSKYSPWLRSWAHYEGKDLDCPKAASAPSRYSSGIRVESFIRKWMNNPIDIFTALQSGPVAISAFTIEGLRHYKRGIMNNPKSCMQGNKKAGHGMTLVGYGKDPKTQTPYWIIQNSWGINYGWGEAGFMRIERGKNICNIEQSDFLAIRAAARP